MSKSKPAGTGTHETMRERDRSLDGVTAAAPEGRTVERPSAFGEEKPTAADLSELDLAQEAARESRGLAGVLRPHRSDRLFLPSLTKLPGRLRDLLVELAALALEILLAPYKKVRLRAYTDGRRLRFREYEVTVSSDHPYARVRTDGVVARVEDSPADSQSVGLATLEYAMTQDSSERRATAAQLWRLNDLGLLTLRDEPELGDRLLSAPVKEVLAAAAMAGLWTPAHGVRGPIRA
jgi:hypothetical protein